MPSGSVISLVDDDPSIRKALTRLMNSAGYNVNTFASAEDFLDCGGLGDGDCIILDVRMPGMSGLELQDQLLKRGVRTPIIFITAHDEGHVQAQAQKAGAVAFLHKPFDDELLLDAIHRALQD